MITLIAGEKDKICKCFHFKDYYQKAICFTSLLNFPSSTFRGPLERFTQSCAVDSTTKSSCQGRPDTCRKAMVGILGTELRTNCDCTSVTADFSQLYDCIGWQRVLWMNPCTGKLSIENLTMKLIYQIVIFIVKSIDMSLVMICSYLFQMKLTKTITKLPFPWMEMSLKLVCIIHPNTRS